MSCPLAVGSPVISLYRFYIGAKPGTTMASNVSVSLVLPEPFQDRDMRVWFKRFEVCAIANKWNEERS